MLDDNRRDLCKYRLERARECLKSAILLRDLGDYASSANRSYYSIFHAIRAIMALDGEDRKKHSGVIAYFQEKYVKTEIFDKDYSYIIKNAFQIRQESDYDDFCIISKEEVDEQLENAERLIAKISEYIKNII